MEFSEAVKQAVGTYAAAIRGSVPKTTLEIRDIDACTTEEDLRGAITQAKVGGELAIRITHELLTTMILTKKCKASES